MAVRKRFDLQRHDDDQAGIKRLKHQDDLLKLHRCAHLRDNMAAYAAKFPAAVAVRNYLGHARWEELEHYRMYITRASIIICKCDREQIQLDLDLPKMRDWICRAFGNQEAERSDQLHTAQVRHARSMAEFKRWFHHLPTLWLVYKLFFDVGKRMRWGEQMRWVVWTLQHPHHIGFNPSAADEVWIRAKIEVYQWLLEVRRSRKK